MRSGSCPRQQTPLAEPSYSMWRAIFTLLPIAPALILLPAIAFASPPDPSWIAGIYDGADGDDIVSLVYETSATKAAAPSHVGPLPCLSEISFEGPVRSAPGDRFTRGPRGPPAPCSPEPAYVFKFPAPPASGTESPITLSLITALQLFPCGDLPASRVRIDLGRAELSQRRQKDALGTLDSGIGTLLVTALKKLDERER
jgi:hypothetical protein